MGSTMFLFIAGVYCNSFRILWLQQFFLWLMDHFGRFLHIEQFT
jgi:hypothetical protein